jgi:uncharacterized protein YbaR (Trm112 family)
VTGQDPTSGADPAAPAYLALLDVLRCPHCRSPFVTPTDAAPAELVCSSCGRAYPVRGGVPVLLVDEARLPDGEPDGAGEDRENG